MAGLNGGRINIAACSLGGAQWALERATQYVKERFTFGEPLAERQSVVFTLADMATELRAARALVRDAAIAMDEKAPDAAMQCAMAKRFATDAGFRVANEALQLHGGYGYLQDYGTREGRARPARAPDPRGHERDHARDHRPRAPPLTPTAASIPHQPIRSARADTSRTVGSVSAGRERIDADGWR